MAQVKIYRLTSDPDRFAGFDMQHEDPIYSALFKLSPMAPKWKGVKVKLDKSSSTELGDFPTLSPTFSPVFSKKALDVMAPLICGAAEALPLGKYSGEDFFVIHVLEEIDALDEANSKFRIVDGVKERVTKFALHDKKLIGKHIFRLPELRRSDPLVSEEFKKRVEKHGLKGAVFTKLA